MICSSAQPEPGLDRQQWPTCALRQAHSGGSPDPQGCKGRPGQARLSCLLFPSSLASLATNVLFFFLTGVKLLYNVALTHTPSL